MKIFKNSIILLALCAINLVSAKRTAQQNIPQQPVQQVVPVPVPTPAKPIPAVKPAPQPVKKIAPAAQLPAQQKPIPTAQAPAVQKPKPVQPGFQQPKPIPQAQPIIPVQPVAQPQAPQKNIPIEKGFITNNVVMALDPRKKETVERGAESMVQTALITLYQKAAPIIMTHNVFEIILTVRQQIGDQNLQKLRSLSAMEQLKASQQLLANVRVAGISSLSVFFLGNILFDANNLNCYFHKSEKLVLLIPKEYIRANSSKAINLSLSDQAAACGFNQAVLTTITDTTPNNLLKQLQIEKTKPENSDKFIFNLTSMFTIQERNGIPISPNQDNSKWIIYLTGHGSPAHMTMEFVRQQYAMMKAHLDNPKNYHIIDPKTQQRMPTAFVGAKAKEYEKMLEGRSGWSNTQLVPESAQIAGIMAPDFAQLMTFFDGSLTTAFVHYVTCFAGGSNQTFVNETLSKLDVDFIASSQGIQEGYTSSQVKIEVRSDKPGIQITGQNFSEFFSLIRKFITTKERRNDSIQTILKTVNLDDRPQNQAFVRFPKAGFFKAIPLSKSTKILTRKIVQDHERERKPIDVRSADIDVLMITTRRIGVPLNLGKESSSGHTAIVFPSPSKFTPAYEAIHSFKEINFEGTLQSFLFHSTYLNARQYPQTSVVQTLKGIDYQQSGLPAQQGAIKNFIIQMKNVSGSSPMTPSQPMQMNPITAQDVKIGTIGLNIKVYFELNQNIYQCSFAIKNFEDPKNLYAYMKKIRFSSQPVKSAPIATIANSLLTPQETSKIRKPITLESITKYIDNKIDRQDPSMVVQSEDDEQALFTFTREHVKK